MMCAPATNHLQPKARLSRQIVADAPEPLTLAGDSSVGQG
jgi:hypothetical protein